MQNTRYSTYAIAWQRYEQPEVVGSMGSSADCRHGVGVADCRHGVGVSGWRISMLWRDLYCSGINDRFASFNLGWIIWWIKPVLRNQVSFDP